MDEIGSLEPATRFAYRMVGKPEAEAAILKSKCQNHPQLIPVCVCVECETPLCRNCVKSVGVLTAFVCETCKSHCLPFKDVLEKVNLLIDKRSGFGSRDTKMALLFPLQEIFVFLLLSGLYGVSLYGIVSFSPTGQGILSGIFGLMFAFCCTSIMFGCVSRIIEHVDQGRTEQRDVLEITSLLSNLPDVITQGFGLLFAISWPGLVAASMGFSSTAVFAIFICWAFVYYPLALGAMTLSHGVFAPVNPIRGLQVLAEMGTNSLLFLGRYLATIIVSVGLILILFLIAAKAGVGVFSAAVLAIPIGIIVSYANAVIAFTMGRCFFKAAYNPSLTIEETVTVQY